MSLTRKAEALVSCRKNFYLSKRNTGMGGETDYAEGSFLHGTENHGIESELLENIQVEHCDEIASPLVTPLQSTSERLARDSATQDAPAERSSFENDSEVGESDSGENTEKTDSGVPESEETAALRLEIAALDEYFFGSLEFPKVHESFFFRVWFKLHALIWFI